MPMIDVHRQCFHEQLVGEKCELWKMSPMVITEQDFSAWDSLGEACGSNCVISSPALNGPSSVPTCPTCLPKPPPTRFRPAESSTVPSSSYTGEYTRHTLALNFPICAHLTTQLPQSYYNHTILAALQRADSFTTLERRRLVPAPTTVNVGVLTNLCLWERELPDSFVDVAVTCPTAPTFASRA